MRLGFIGLGKMGNRMVTKLLSEGHEVVVWNRTEEKIKDLQLKVQSEKLKVAERNSKSHELSGRWCRPGKRLRES